MFAFTRLVHLSNLEMSFFNEQKILLYNCKALYSFNVLCPCLFSTARFFITFFHDPEIHLVLRYFRLFLIVIISTIILVERLQTALRNKSPSIGCERPRECKSLSFNIYFSGELILLGLLFSQNIFCFVHLEVLYIPNKDAFNMIFLIRHIQIK